MMGRVADGNEIVQHWPFNPKDINANVSSRYSSFSACLPNIFSARLSKARLESYYVLLQTGRQLIIHIFAQNAISLLWRKSTLVAWATFFPGQVLSRVTIVTQNMKFGSASEIAASRNVYTKITVCSRCRCAKFLVYLQKSYRM